MAEAVLGDLRKRKTQILDKLYLTVKVDHWDDDGGAPVFVTYKPVTNASIDKAREKAAKGGQSEVEGNAELLVEGCHRVSQLVDGKHVGFHADNPGDFCRFDSKLAEVLGLPGDPPAELICRELFLVEGNLLAHAGALITFSGQKLAEIDTTLAGE